VAQVQEFFDALAHAGYRPALRQVSGTVRCDLAHDGEVDHWLVRIDRGEVRVSKEDAPADCVIHADEDTFARIVSGRLSPMVALLRGMAVVEGSEELTLALQRLVPDSPSTADAPESGG
jgi:putative sterol carrier protein